jgi:hypothetical protein
MDAKEQERRVRNARIESLQRSPAWDDLIDMFEQIEERFWRIHIADLRAGKAIDQRKLDRALGMFDGIRDVCKAPVKAARKLERLNESDSEEAS